MIPELPFDIWLQILQHLFNNLYGGKNARKFATLNQAFAYRSKYHADNHIVSKKCV